MSTNASTRPTTKRSASDADAGDAQKTIRVYAVVASVLLMVGIVVAFAQVRHFSFAVIDDGNYVTDNRQIESGLSWATVKWCFTQTVAANWHPLTMLSHALDCQLFGLNPGPHHLVNLLFHTANTLLLFWFLFTVTARASTDAKTKVWMCALVAALFGLHPLRAESVAWVSERKDVLSTFFFLLTLMSYARYIRLRERAGAKAPIVVAYSTALFLFALGLLSKPMLVTLPFVLLLTDFWPFQRLRDFQLRSIGPLVVEKIPFFLLTIAFSATTFLTQKQTGVVVTLESFPLSERLGNGLVSYARYLGKTFWPVDLAICYPYRVWSAGHVAAAGALMLVVSALAFWLARRRPFIFIGWFWFVGMLVPVIGLAQVGTQSMADRYAYLPHIGLFIAVVWGLVELGRKPALIALTICAVATAFVGKNQVAYWKDSEALFDHTLRVTGDNLSAQYFMALALESKHKNAEAVPYFQLAVRGNPDNIKAHYHLGRIFASLGKLDDAVRSFEAALAVDPDLPLTRLDLADALMKQGKREEATEQFIRALQSRPDVPEAHYELSNLLAAKHDFVGALDHLKIAVRLKPDWPLALNGLAWMLATHPNKEFRNGADAVRFAEQAVSLTKNSDPGMMDTLAAAYAEAGRFDDAIKTAESAVKVASAANQSSLAAEIQTRLKLYRAGTAYRE